LAAVMTEKGLETAGFDRRESADGDVVEFRFNV
jgi:hypothetical protein